MIRLLAVAVLVLTRLPHDEGGFVHKRIFGGIKGAIGGLIGGGPLGILGGAVGGFVGADRKAPIATRTSAIFHTPTVTSLVPSTLQATCPPGFARTAGGGCVPIGRPTPKQTSPIPGDPGGRRFDPLGVIKGRFAELFPTDGVDVNGQPLVGPDAFGEARMGRFGAGLEPFIVDRMTRKCPTGSILGKVEADGSFLCYNKRDLSNKERKWPRGRRPLLTGGEMRCISVASSAAKKLQRKQKQLEQLGLLKRPSRARRALPAGHVAEVKHA